MRYLLLLSILTLAACSTTTPRIDFSEMEPAFCKWSRVDEPKMISCFRTYDDCMTHIPESDRMDYHCDNRSSNPWLSQLGDE